MATHISTKLSISFPPNVPQLNEYTDTQAYDIPTYQQQLQAKLAELQRFVETNSVESAHAQKSYYDTHCN